MAGLIYYLAGKRAVSEEDLRKAGLGYALDGAGGPSHVAAEKGPDGGAGVMFTLPDARGENPPVQALAASARWTRIPDVAGAWVGFDPKDPPGPGDLCRREKMVGHDVEMGDGRKWTVPVAIRFPEGTCLPRSLSWDGSRWAQGDVVPRYRELFAAAQRIWDNLVNATKPGEEAGEVTVTLSEEAGVCACALAVNYRLGPAEISALGLFDEQSEANAALALVDWPAVLEYARKKKQALEAASSQPGGGA